MPINGTLSQMIGGSYGATGLSLKLTWEIMSQNVAANTSTVRVYFQITNHNISAGLVVGERGGTTITIDGTTYTFNAPATNKTTSGYWTTTLGTKDVVIPHNADGTKTLNLSGYYPIAATLSGTYYSAVSISGTGVLNPIPKSSIPTLSDDTPTLGESITIYTNRTSTSNTHTLKYTLGTDSGTIVENLETDHSWTLPLSLANAIPNNASAVGVITCETYNGTTLVGTATVNFTASVPDTMVPTISAVNITEAVSGLYAQFAAYVQSKSRLAVQTTAAGAYSSTISQVRVTIEGKHYTGASITSDAIAGSGTITVTVLVTDSRGKTATTSSNVTVQAYSAPQITTLDPSRVNSSGVPTDDGTSIAVLMSFTISSVSDKNTKAWTMEYRIAGTEPWTAIASGSVYSYNATHTNLTGLFEINNSYDIRLSLTDYFTTISRIATLGTAFAIFNFNPSGKGVAFGKVSELDALEIDMPTVFTETPTVEGQAVWHDGNDAGLLAKYKKNLYDNASGSNATITLSETAANFAYLDIYSIDDDGVANFTRVHAPNGKSARLSGAVVTATGRIYIKVALIAISGTSVTFTQNKHSAQSADANAYIRSDGATDGAYQKITRIDGWIA